MYGKLCDPAFMVITKKQKFQTYYEKGHNVTDLFNKDTELAAHFPKLKLPTTHPPTLNVTTRKTK